MIAIRMSTDSLTTIFHKLLQAKGSLSILGVFPYMTHNLRIKIYTGLPEITKRSEAHMVRSVALLLILSKAIFAADPADGIREASAGWRDAAIKQDKAGLNRWLAEDLCYSHSNGLTQNKAEYIAAVTKGPAHYETFKESDTKITIYGSAAVLTGFEDVTPHNGQSYRVRRLEVYVKNNGRWQMAAHQSARVRQP
jgi:hypothetical protein